LHTDEQEALSIIRSKAFDEKKSAIKRYRELVGAETSFSSWLKYEVIVTSCSWVPGALGIFLRKVFYRSMFYPRLENVIFGKNIDVFNAKRIRIGKKCLIGDNCLLDVKGKGRIKIGNNVSIGRGTLIRVREGSIEIGDNTTIGAYSHVSGIGTDVVIGKDVMIAGYCYIIGSQYSFDKIDVPMRLQIEKGKGIVISDDVWLGGGVYVIDGNNIGSGSIIGTGSVVAKSIPESSIAVGVPANIIKSRI
jgi:acetyltransferase-like isoleucine patch superfamily enzyme